MTAEIDRFFRFRSFELDVAERELRHRDKLVTLTPKAFDALVHLLENHSHLVTKEELLAAVWPDSFVEEGNVPRTIHTIRKTLELYEPDTSFIQTIPTKGYRFVAEVERSAESREEQQDTGQPNRTNGSTFFSTRSRAIIATLALVMIAGSVGIVVIGFKNDPKKATSHTNNGEAFRHFQQGKMLTERRLQGDLEEALVNFERAIALDPEYSAAYAGKANVNSLLFIASNSHKDIVQAREGVRKAIELDPNNSLAHTVLCRIQGTYDWDFTGAVRTCERAVELDPNDAEAHRELGFAYNVLGIEEKALDAMARTVELAPTSFNKRSLGVVLYHSRRYDEAISHFEQVETTDPAYQETSKWLIRAFQMKNDHIAALRTHVDWKRRNGASPDEIGSINAAFENGGWNAVLRQMTEAAGQDKRLRPNMVDACNFAQLGEHERAFEVLGKMFERRAIMIVTIAREPALDPLRDDPRFKELLRSIKLN